MSAALQKVTSDDNMLMERTDGCSVTKSFMLEIGVAVTFAL